MRSAALLGFAALGFTALDFFAVLTATVPVMKSSRV
jgi:hypothetical protein